MFTPDEKVKLKKLAEKHPEVTKLLQEYNKFATTDYTQSYVIAYDLKNYWEKKAAVFLQTKDATGLGGGKEDGGLAFSQMFMSKVTEWAKALDDLRLKMRPETEEVVREKLALPKEQKHTIAIKID